MLGIIGLLKSLFSGISAIASWLHDRTLIDAGKAELEDEANKQALKNMEIADEVDSTPLPDDILGGLRKNKNPPN